MSRKPVSSVTPFDFRSDFDTPAPNESQVTMTVSELAALLDDARRSTAEMLRDEQVKLQADAMRDSAESLKAALRQIVELAELLESSTLSEETRDEAVDRVRAVAAELIDGQGNLFQS
ncbi:hypothetical protein [Henriciella sp.]|uniref:hypothetical protein n=1 Tax=Henriciella sp. TaxID=1968823 RepID=UPI002630D860|nr:hypothetical protein [Henriciella sp.]